MTENPTLSRAIAYLGAVEVAPGRYAYKQRDYIGEPGTYVVANAWTIREVPIAEGNSKQAAQALALTHTVQMPRWWTPERRFAVRLQGDILGVYMRAGTSAARALECSLHAEAITVDLATGKEIPA